MLLKDWTHDATLHAMAEHAMAELHHVSTSAIVACNVASLPGADGSCQNQIALERENIKMITYPLLAF